MAPKLRIRETKTLEYADNVLVKKSAMTGTERLQKRRPQIYQIKVNHHGKLNVGKIQ